jgi:hypothetical protein
MMMKSTKPETGPLALPAPDKATKDAAAVNIPIAKSPVDIAVNRVLQDFDLVYSRNKKAYAVDRTTANPTTYRIDSRGFSSVIRQRVYLSNPEVVLKQDQLNDATGQVAALTELKGKLASVWLRVAKTEHGIELDIGDDTQARIAVEPDKVTILYQGSQTLFERNPNFLPFAMPAAQCDIKKLRQYLNLTEEEQWLVIAWITYTLKHPKIPSSNYVSLVLRGAQGDGKSTMCNVTLGSLVGPSVTGVQAFPGSQVDLAIAVQNSHVVFYDNLRKLTPAQADNVSRCCTSAALSTREYYTNGGEYTHTLHGAVVLNGIHGFIDQADLFQRCLTLTLQPLAAGDRATEHQLRADFQNDLPVIFRGVLDLTASILKYLPNVTAKYPERMLEFVHWLAAMEKAMKLPEGQLQKSYSNNLIRAIRDSLEDDPLADAVIQFAQQQNTWTGTPGDLLLKLGQFVPALIIPTVAWPQNEIALSKRLKKQKSLLSGAGVDIVLGKRSKRRQISITNIGQSS